MYSDHCVNVSKGASALIVGFPFDTGRYLSWQCNFYAFKALIRDEMAVKVRMQSPDFTGKYQSTFQSIPRIIREERILGLFKGITSPLVETIQFSS